MKPDEKRLCAKCGAELKAAKRCPKCGAEADQGIEVEYKDFKISELLDIRMPGGPPGKKGKGEEKK